MSRQVQAKGIQRPDVATGQPLDRLSPSLEAEVGEALERVLAHEKAETLAGALDRSRSTVYSWAGHPGQIPVAALPIIASFDPDPEFMSRIAGHLLAWVAARSLRRRAEGGLVTILHEMGVNVGADPESVRRATGRGEMGDD